MKIVVNITAWRRVDYLEKTITALKNCYNFNDFSYRVIVDGGYSKKQDEIKLMLSRNEFNCELIMHPNNLGCAGNVGYAFISSFDEHMADAVIMLEDDTMPSKDFLIYMRDMLKKYKNDKNIWSVSGYNRRSFGTRTDRIKNLISNYIPFYKPFSNSSNLLGDPYSVFSRDHFTSWGWDMWERNREKINNGWFGIHWNHKDGKTGLSCPRGDEFMNYVYRANDGSWAWPMNM